MTGCASDGRQKPWNIKKRWEISGLRSYKQDLSDYISKKDVQEHYLSKREVEAGYVSRSDHEAQIEELEQTVKALQQAKTELFRKMFGRDGEESRGKTPKRTGGRNPLWHGGYG